jgi:hypothetical protein
MKKFQSLVLYLFAILSVSFIGCEKNDETVPTSEKLTLHLHTMVGSEYAAYGVSFTDETGRQFNLTDFRYYLSNFVLINESGDEIPVSGKVVLAGPSSHEYELGDVPSGNYRGFRFLVGLDSATNHTDPTIYASDNPLSIQSPGIHWDWNSGYIFMKVEGFVDTTLNNSGTPDYEFFYHVGMDALKRTIDFSTSSFEVKAGTDAELVLDLDLRKVLTNVDMRTENETHTFNNMPLAEKIADNWQSAFTAMRE